MLEIIEFMSIFLSLFYEYDPTALTVKVYLRVKASFFLNFEESS